MFKYLKYCSAIFTISVAIFCAYTGENSMWHFFFGLSLVVIIGDAVLGYDTKTENYKYPIFLNLMMYLSLPLLIILIATMCYRINDQSLISFIGYTISIGLLLGAFAINIGHELTHRKNSKLDMFIGNWLQALCWDNAFAIELAIKSFSLGKVVRAPPIFTTSLLAHKTISESGWRILIFALFLADLLKLTILIIVSTSSIILSSI